MYKVLLVDDDLLVRNYLRSLLDWKMMGFDLVGEASNGNEALKQIELLSPDVVIMDINMPVMDGVELSYQISNKYPELKMFALSSYDDYQFVRETLKNGAVDYILKDRLNKEELTRILAQLLNLIEKEKGRKIELETEKIRIEAIKEIASEQYVKEIFLGTRKHDDEIIKSMGLPFEKVCKGGYIIAIMYISNYNIRTSRKSDAEKQVFINSISNLCKQTLEDDSSKLWTYLEEGKFGIVLPSSGSNSEAALHSVLNQKTRRISHILNQYLNVQVVWGISSRCFSIDNINNCYSEALSLVMKQQYQQYFKDSHEALSDKMDKKIFFLSIHHEKELLQAIETADNGRAEKTLNTIFNELIRAQSIESTQTVVNELISTAIKAASEYGLNVKKIYEYCGVDINDLSSVNSTEALKTTIKRIYKTLIEEATKGGCAGNYSKYTRKAIEHLNLNFKKDISLVNMAGLLGINPEYFSRLFKKETGYGFVEYLNKLRIEMSKRYLSQGKENLKNISIEVGFNSYSYFCKVFKEYTGLSPLNFVEQNTVDK